MNVSTTRCTKPAAAPRTGGVAAALPHDPGLDRILADTRLSPTAKLIAIAIVKNWAWVKDHCWPSDRTIAAKLGKSPGHVQRCLRELEAAGWIRRERTDAVRSGRRIWLNWRCPGGTGAEPSPAPARSDPPAPARSERDVVVKAGMEPEEFVVEILERSRPEPDPVSPPDPTVLAAPLPEPEPVAVPPPDSASTTVSILEPEPEALPVPWVAPAPPPAPPARPSAPAMLAVPLTPEQQARLAELPEAARDQVLTWLATGDPILGSEARKRLLPPRPRPEAPRTLPEVLARIREDPAFPALAADWLARALGDRKSYSGFLARCTEAWRGEVPVERLVSAFEQVTGPKAKNPGAVFMHVLAQRSP